MGYYSIIPILIVIATTGASLSIAHILRRIFSAQELTRAYYTINLIFFLVATIGALLSIKFVFMVYNLGNTIEIWLIYGGVVLGVVAFAYLFASRGKSWSAVVSVGLGLSSLILLLSQILQRNDYVYLLILPCAGVCIAVVTLVLKLRSVPIPIHEVINLVVSIPVLIWLAVSVWFYIGQSLLP